MPIFTPELEFSDDYPTIEPSLRLDFANARALDPRITFTRASTATYVGRDGLIKYARANEPRFDHDPATDESLGLLIEESRTNVIPYSVDFSNAAWTKINGGTGSAPTVTANYATSPDGTTTASRIQAELGNGTSSSDYSLVRDSITNDGTDHTWSVWLKSNTTSNQNVIISWYHPDFVSPPDVVTVTPTWKRFSLTKQQPGFEADIGMRGDSTNITRSVDILAWGGQLEDGAFPTSYIPTSGSTVTREKEFPVIETSSIDFNDFSQGGEGTLVCEFSNAGSTGSDIAVCFSGDTHDGATFVGLGTNSNRNAFNRNRVNTTNTVLSVDNNFTTTGFYKVAFGIGQSRCTLAVRGSSSGVLEDTSVSYDSTPYTKLILGCDQTTSSINNMINGTIKSIFYYPTLLTDTQLQTLTQ